MAGGRDQAGAADRGQPAAAVGSAEGSAASAEVTDAVRRSFRKVIEEQNAPLISAVQQLVEEVRVLKSQRVEQAAQAAASPSPLTTAPTSVPPPPPALANPISANDQRIADLEEQLRVARAQKAVAPSEAETSARGAAAASCGCWPGRS